MPEEVISDTTPVQYLHQVGRLDALIAGCAAGYSVTLLTFSSKYYRVVPNLKVEQPYGS